MQVEANNKKIFIFGIIIAISALGGLSTVFANGGDHPWCYNEEKCGPASWSGICKSGHAQSPIDFNPSLITESKRLHSIRINKAYKEEYPEFYIKNNGHTVQIQLSEDLTSPLHIHSDGFKTNYQLSQLHFHWGSKDDIGSEHTIDGKSYAMELHLVHFSNKYASLLEALTDQNPRALAVFGIFFNVSTIDNPAMNPIIEAIPIVESYHPDPALVKSTVPLNFSALFPEVLDIYRYEGSLTTPSCGQKVVWTMFKNPVPISESQIEVFRRVKDTLNVPMVDNYRPTQPQTRRKVLESTVNLLDLLDSQTSNEDMSQGVRSLDTSKENEVSETTNSNPSAHGHHDYETQHRNETERSSTTRLLGSQSGIIFIILFISSFSFKF